MSETTPLLTLRHPGIEIGGQRLFAGAEWTIQRGQHWAVIGANGAGKTLLADLVCRRLPGHIDGVRYGFSPDGALSRHFSRGQIVCIDARSRQALNPDSFHQARWNSTDRDSGALAGDLLTGRSIEFVSRYQVGPTRVSAREYARRRDQAVDLLGIRHLLDRRLIHLSNGEGRKLLLARALMQRPYLLLLDDPFGGLDSSSRAHLRRVLDALTRQQRPQLVLLVTRPEQIPAGITHVLRLERCQIADSGPRDQVLSALVERLVERSPGDPQPTSADPERAVHMEPPAGAGTSADIGPGAGAQPPAELHPDAARDTRETGARPAAPSGSAHAAPSAGARAAGETADILVEMRDVSLEYGGVTILDRISWIIRAGQRWLLTGPNGAGKSALLSLILGDNPQAYSNHILLFGRRRGSGESVWELKRRIGWVAPELQRHHPLHLPCGAVVCSGFHDTLGLYRAPTREQIQASRRWLEELDIGDAENRPFGAASSGVQRLVLLARALVKDPALLILDEPCQGLDETQSRRLIGLVDRLCARRDLALVYVTHDLDERPAGLTHALRLQAGRVIFQGPLQRPLSPPGSPASPGSAGSRASPGPLSPLSHGTRGHVRHIQPAADHRR